MAGLSTGAGAHVVKVYHEKSMILPDVSRVLACLYEKDVAFETEKGSYKDILRLQATRSVPVPFYDGDTFRQESRAICRYIAETYEQRGYPFLLGKDVLERASIEQWLRHEEHAFDPPSRALFCHLAFPLHDEDISNLDREKRKLDEVLEVYEQRLGESEFLAGNKFTLADLVHLPNTHHIMTSKSSDKFAYLYDSRKNVQRWWNTISARESWQKVVRYMKSVEEEEEQYQKEELEEEELFQQQQWQMQTDSPPTSGGRSIHMDSRKQTGTDSRTILVPPPSDGTISSSFFTVPQEHQPLPAETTSHGKTSPDQRKENNFFNTTEKTQSPSKQKTSATQKSPSSTTSNFFTPATRPTTTKMFQITDSDKSTSKDTSSTSRTSQGSSKDASDRLHRSDFYQTSNHTDEAAIHTKPTSQEASKTSDRVSQARQTGEAPNKPSPGSAKAPQEIAPDKTTKESSSSVQSTTSTFFTPTTQEIAPDKTTQKSSRSFQSTTSTFFTPATPPTTTKMPQRTDTDKSTSKDASSPTKPSQGLSKEAPDKPHLSEFYKARSHTDEAQTLTKPTPQEASDRIYTPRQTSEAVAPDKPSQASAKASRRIDGPDFYETVRKPTSVDPSADNQVPYTKPDDPQTPRSPYTRSAAQRAADTSGPKAGETPSDKRSAVQTPYAQQSYEQSKKAATDQRAAAAKEVQGETAPQARYRGAEDSTKEAREADQKRAASAPTRELSSGSQNTPQQSKAPPTDLKVSDLSPMQAEYEDTQGENERFSTKRLGQMLEQSDEEALKLQSTDLQVPPEKEETPSVYKKPPHVQDRKGQADNLSVDGRTDGTPSTGTRAPDTPTSAAERRATSSPLKGGMAPDGHGATEPRKSPSISEQQPAPPMQSQSPTSSVSRASASSNGAAQDDDLAQLSTIDQWRRTSTPVIQQGPPGAPSIDRLDEIGGVDRRAQPSPPKKTITEQSDKSPMDERTPRMTPRQAPPSDPRRTSASTLPSQEPVPLQQTTKLAPAPYGITGEKSANIAMADESATPPVPLQTPASDGRRVSTALQGRILDARGENEAVKPSVTDPRGTPTMPKKQESTPGFQRRTNTTSDQSSDQAPPLPSFADTRNKKTGITEASQMTTIAADEQPGGRAPKNSGNKRISSDDIGKQTSEAVYHRTSATSREMPLLGSEKSMKEQQLQSDKSSISPQDNSRQGSEAALLVPGTQQPKKRELLTNADQNSGKTPGQTLQQSVEETSPDTQQMKYNRNNRKLDGSSKPTQFDGNEGDVPESQRGDSSTNP